MEQYINIMILCVWYIIFKSKIMQIFSLRFKNLFIFYKYKYNIKFNLIIIQIKKKDNLEFFYNGPSNNIKSSFKRNHEKVWRRDYGIKKDWDWSLKLNWFSS
jgi:hypothetical protein